MYEWNSVSGVVRLIFPVKDDIKNQKTIVQCYNQRVSRSPLQLANLSAAADAGDSLFRFFVVFLIMLLPCR